MIEVGPLLAEGKLLFDCLICRAELGSRLLVVERETGEEVATVPLDGSYCLHLANAWDESDRLTVDLFELDRPAYEQYQPLPWCSTLGTSRQGRKPEAQHLCFHATFVPA
ncbi:MAG TPA: carotenoid oxygenase family protein [Thermoanaerobaculia bacterium]|nr:carotenoid oxygenase family protein [Thermoanaerobaculia bacterium]